ncbi:MAG: ferredoxin [bacterium]|nr:ferredoxin [bacterium]
MPRIAKIVVDRDLCIGAASCVTIAPDVFFLDDENKAVLLPKSDSAWADYETVLMAAQSCPTKAIFLYDEEGNQLYPE